MKTEYGKVVGAHVVDCLMNRSCECSTDISDILYRASSEDGRSMEIECGRGLGLGRSAGRGAPEMT
jgi:hypothetical protein